MSKSVMLSGYYGFENLGDDLILDVLVKSLKSFGMSPVVLSNNPPATAALYGIEAIQRIELPRIWQRLAETQAFISGGGGLFQDVTGPGSPIYYGGLIEMAALRKVPVAFFAQGVGPLRTRLGRLMLKRAIRHAQFITVRDSKSQFLVEELAKLKPMVMADPVWLWQPPENLLSLPKLRPGISLRPWPALQDPEIDQLAKGLALLPNIRETGINLIDCQAGMDILPLAKLEKRLVQQQIPCIWFNQSRCLEGIAQSTGLIGMRYHALLVAVKFAIPVLALSYDPKVQQLAMALKIRNYAVSTLAGIQPERFMDALGYGDVSTVSAFQQSAAQGIIQLQEWLDALPRG